ncbi:response regulator [Lysobacter sp. LF1]|uniref:Response regulator n=1 Tax=Lysobacter stagni TaxID=3045172 RepID=A0ABT6XKV4_9GAMM|nr:response regulator [Lysobacter sp. LF1]MDI9240661.1 response regulator [Lysobacter sp. LF1]
MAEARLLFVEDEDDLRMLVGEALRMLGFHVVAVADGPSALAAMQESSFDVLVSDVSMPHGISGIELAEHTLRVQPGARIVLASGFARAQLPPLPPGVSFLPKPYRIGQLAALIRERLPVSG